MKYSDIKQDTPKLVVKYKKTDDGKEDWSWGVTAKIPIIHLVGYIVGLQRSVIEGYIQSGEDREAVIAWYGDKFHSFIGAGIPDDGLVGYLEMINNTLVGAAAVNRVADNSFALYGPDGNPIR